METNRSVIIISHHPSLSVIIRLADIDRVVCGGPHFQYRERYENNIENCFESLQSIKPLKTLRSCPCKLVKRGGVIEIYYLHCYKKYLHYQTLCTICHLFESKFHLSLHPATLPCIPLLHLLLEYSPSS